MTQEKSMLAVSINWEGIPSFRLVPMTNDCPYVDVVYDPIKKVLLIFSKTKKEEYAMIIKLDDKGFPLMLNREKEGQQYARERRLTNTFYEYGIQVPTEIEYFLSYFMYTYNPMVYAVLNPPVMNVAPVFEVIPTDDELGAIIEEISQEHTSNEDVSHDHSDDIKIPVEVTEENITP